MSTTPSCSIMGSRGVKAKRPMPMAAASAAMPASATCSADALAWMAWGFEGDRSIAGKGTVAGQAGLPVSS